MAILKLSSWSCNFAEYTNSTESAFFKRTVSKSNFKAYSFRWKLKKNATWTCYFSLVSLGFDWGRQIGRLLWGRCKGLKATGRRNVCHVWRNTSRLENPRKCWREYWSIESTLWDLLDWIAAFTRVQATCGSWVKWRRGVVILWQVKMAVEYWSVWGRGCVEECRTFLETNGAFWKKREFI